MPSHSLRQRRITEFVEVREFLWVPPRLRGDLPPPAGTNRGFAKDPEGKPAGEGGD